jgi:hypothetical protein
MVGGCRPKRPWRKPAEVSNARILPAGVEGRGLRLTGASLKSGAFEDLARRQCGGDLFGGRWVDHAANRGNTIGGDAYALSVLMNNGFVARHVYAINFVSSDVAVQPLNVRPEGLQNVGGFLRNFAELCIGKTSGPGNFTLDDEFRHGGMLASGQ